MKHPDELARVLEEIEMDLRKGNIDFKQADAGRAAALAVSYRLVPKLDAALAANAEMRAALEAAHYLSTEWRSKVADALARTDLGRGWASPEDTAQMVGALQMVESDGEFDSLHEVTRKSVVDVLALLKKGGG